MIEPKLEDEVKFEMHGYFYARQEDHKRIGELFDQLFGYLASEGLGHNFLHRTTPMLCEREPIPIYANEADLPEDIAKDEQWRRLCFLEAVDVAQKVIDTMGQSMVTTIFKRINGEA